MPPKSVADLIAKYLIVKPKILAAGRDSGRLISQMNAEEYAGLLLKTTGSVEASLRAIENAKRDSWDLEATYPGVTKLLQEAY